MKDSTADSNNGRNAEILDKVAAILAVGTTTAVLAAAMVPYFLDIPKDNHNLIVQGQTTIWNGWLVILSFYFGTTVGGRKYQNTIERQAKVIEQTVPPNVTDGKVQLRPGEEVNVEAKTN